MNVDLRQVLVTFLAESRDLLQAMEDGLLQLERQPDDAEAVNAIFRTAHTIKGSAGLFGLDAVVAFTHAVENTLDRVRDGTIAVSPDLIALLLECGDHIGAHIDHVAAHGSDPPGDDMQDRNAALIQRLGGYSGAAHQRPPAGSAKDTIPSCAAGVQSDLWHISLRFGRDVLRHGLDPLSFLRYLTTLGDMGCVTTIVDGIPPITDLDPESCYLGFEIGFKSAADKKTIEDVFEFVHDDCQIRILPPHCAIEDYVALIHEHPEEDAFLGDILVASGAITRKELQEGLKMQQAAPPAPDGTATKKIGEILVEQKVVQRPVVDAALEKQQQARDAKGKDHGSVRVPADKLDRLINLVGELVIANASANLLAQQSGMAALQEASFGMARLVEEIRDGALRLRMVEIGETFHRFHRVVRDVGRELGKEIELVITGAETELDKSVVEKIGDPLMHLVRNAIDHGIEPREVREARSKPPKGHVRLNAFHESGSIVIEVADDGGGLKRDKIIERARERGLLATGQELTDPEIYKLIFEAGFSTAEKVTDISGRGVGMDVVRRNIEALQGTVEIDSKEGLGTTVRVRLPLTLAIIDGFLVSVGSVSYVVPLDMVLECVELGLRERDAGYINLRGDILPLLRLREHFGRTARPGRRESVVVVTAGGKKAGLVVDELLGEFQTVIKPLGRMFQHIKGVSGSTILGSGEVALILEVGALVQQAAGDDGGRVRAA